MVNKQDIETVALAIREIKCYRGEISISKKERPNDLKSVDETLNKLEEMYFRLQHPMPDYYKYFRQQITLGGPDEWVNAPDGTKCAVFTVQDEDIKTFPSLKDIQTVSVWNGGAEIVERSNQRKTLRIG